jgi:dTDP-4-amino-4,6-dideoxygalactose transaminase
MDKKRIPFNRAAVVGREYEYMSLAVTQGHISGDGPFAQKCQHFLEEKFEVGKALLTTSCTHALEMAALLLDIKAGDEVILPSFTFVSTANAFVIRGAVPIFADIRPDTLNLDERNLPRLVTPRTKAIVAVHYAGIGCCMESILEVAGKSNIPVVEDNAHGLFGKYQRKYLGTFGCLATQSFHETKNLTCGEGGALLINDPRLVERAEIIREKGTNRSRFFRGQVDKYTWLDIGSSYLPSDILAAYLYAQVEKWQEIQTRRETVWTFYFDRLQDWSRQQGVGLPFVPADCEQPYHIFYLLLPTLEDRTKLIAHLAAQDIHTAFHYVPLHLSEMGRRFHCRQGDCPITEALSARLLRLPLYYGLDQDDLWRIVSAIQQFQCAAQGRRSAGWGGVN